MCMCVCVCVRVAVWESKCYRKRLITIIKQTDNNMEKSKHCEHELYHKELHAHLRNITKKISHGDKHQTEMTDEKRVNYSLKNKKKMYRTKKGHKSSIWHLF